MNLGSERSNGLFRKTGEATIGALIGQGPGVLVAPVAAFVLGANQQTDAAFLALAPPRETMVVVMSDAASRPAITVSWREQQLGQKRLRVRVIGHQSMDAGTTWELWMIPPGGANPVSLGLIDTHETQTVVVPPELQSAINSALALAMSVEPEGGSPTGLPTGPVIYQGPRLEL